MYDNGFSRGSIRLITFANFNVQPGGTHTNTHIHTHEWFPTARDLSIATATDSAAVNERPFPSLSRWERKTLNQRERGREGSQFQRPRTCNYVSWKLRIPENGNHSSERGSVQLVDRVERSADPQAGLKVKRSNEQRDWH